MPTQLALALAAFAALAAARAAPSTFKIYLLAGQSNMEGQAEVDTRNATTGAFLNGTLAYQVRDPRTAALFAPLWDASANAWVTLRDVKVWYNENGTVLGINGSNIPSAPGEASFGDLSVGFGVAGDPARFGPELGFGFAMHDAAAPGEKILVMKTAWGGKTLAGDFRPPSSAAAAAAGRDPYCTGACAAAAGVGHYYSVMVNDTHKMLAPGAAAAMFPDLAGLTPVLGGFGWFQVNETAAYETNLVNLVKDLRAEFGIADLPVSIAASGFDGFTGEEATRAPPSAVPWVDMDPDAKVRTNCAGDSGCRRLDIVLSQLAAANATRHPELGGHVQTAETRGFWREARFSPNQAQGYHYFHNAETYYLVGRAMGAGMIAAAA